MNVHVHLYFKRKTRFYTVLLKRYRVVTWEMIEFESSKRFNKINVLYLINYYPLCRSNIFALYNHQFIGLFNVYLGNLSTYRHFSLQFA